MTTIIIPFFSNIDGLAVLLTLLGIQTQIANKIIVIDNSIHGLAKDLCIKYQLRTPIDYYTQKGTIYESWNFAIDNSIGDVIILNDDVLVPIHFVKEFNYFKKKNDFLCYVPEVPPIDHREIYIDRKFNGINQKTTSIVEAGWMPGFCFMLPRSTIYTIGIFDTNFKIWFGDFDYQERIKRTAYHKKTKSIGQIRNLYVYHYGTTSYNLLNWKVKKIISQDEKYFNEKYGIQDFSTQLIEQGKLVDNSKYLIPSFSKKGMI